MVNCEDPDQTAPQSDLSLHCLFLPVQKFRQERDGSVVERQTPAPEVVGSKPTSAVLCP